MKFSFLTDCSSVLWQRVWNQLNGVQKKKLFKITQERAYTLLSLLVLRKTPGADLQASGWKHSCVNMKLIFWHFKFQWLCKERRVTKYIQISWKGRNFTFNAHVLKLPEPNRINQYSNKKFLNSNNFPDSKISTSTRIWIHSHTQDSSGNMGNRACVLKRAKFASWPFTVKNWVRSCYAIG